MSAVSEAPLECGSEAAALDGTEGKAVAAATRTPRRGKLRPQTLKALHAEWRKLSPNLVQGDVLTERDLRLEWTNSKLKIKNSPPVASWRDLTDGQAKFLLKKMKAESGSQADYLTHRIADLAITLTDSVAWWEFVTARCKERFQIPNPKFLSPAQAHALIEELLRRISEKEGVTIEAVRKRFSPQRTRRNSE